MLTELPKLTLSQELTDAPATAGATAETELPNATEAVDETLEPLRVSPLADRAEPTARTPETLSGAPATAPDVTDRTPLRLA